MPADSGRISHWDLLLEPPTGFGDTLLTFASPTPPEAWVTATIVQQLPDHRHLYLDYEGPVSGNRGNVSRVLSGTIQWKEFSSKSLIASVLSSGVPAPVYIFMEQGILRLTKLIGHPGDGSQWELEFQTATVSEPSTVPDLRGSQISEA